MLLQKEQAEEKKTENNDGDIPDHEDAESNAQFESMGLPMSFGAPKKRK